MLKRFNKARIRCPVVVHDEINAVFWEEKDPRRTKTKMFPIFNVFMQLLSNFR